MIIISLYIQFGDRRKLVAVEEWSKYETEVEDRHGVGVGMGLRHEYGAWVLGMSIS